MQEDVHREPWNQGDGKLSVPGKGGGAACTSLRVVPIVFLLVFFCFFLSESESRSIVSDSLRPHGLYSPWNSPGQNTGVGSRFLLLGIFPTQGLNPGLSHCRRTLYQLSHKGSPLVYLEHLLWSKISEGEAWAPAFK